MRMCPVHEQNRIENIPQAWNKGMLTLAPYRTFAVEERRTSMVRCQYKRLWSYVATKTTLQFNISVKGIAAPSLCFQIFPNVHIIT